MNSHRLGSRNSYRLVGAFVVNMLAVASPALAGPPLICHPFQNGSSKLLTWNDGPGWNNPSPSYNLKKLTADTLAVLDADETILTRMENLRRAAIYAQKDPVVAHQLLKALVDRALTNQATSLAWFDAGYIVEAYEQAVHMRVSGSMEGYGRPANYDRKAWAAVDETIKLDGYGFVKKALMIGGSNAEMEFAASLMTQGPQASEHRARAAAGAARGSYLEKNLNAW